MITEEQNGPCYEVYVTRDAVLTRTQRLHGYELLYRAPSNGAANVAADECVRAIGDALLSVGLDRVVWGHRTFLPVSRDMLIKDFSAMLPQREFFLEILQPMDVDDDLLKACRNLKSQGHQLVLGERLSRAGVCPLLGLADCIKVDFHSTSKTVRSQIAQEYRRNRKLILLASNLQTKEAFAEALELGYELFQGTFYSRPLVVRSKALVGSKLTHLRMLGEINGSELNLSRLEGIVKHDPSLVHTLLRYINSAGFGLQREVCSVRHAFVMLGEWEVRRWISLVVLTKLVADKPLELAVQAVVRGRFCELASPFARLGNRSAEAFLMGLFSKLDAILEQPMARVVREVPKSEDVRCALLGQPASKPGMELILGLANAYHEGDWQPVDETGKLLQLPAAKLKSIFAESIEWASNFISDK